MVRECLGPFDGGRCQAGRGGGVAYVKWKGGACPGVAFEEGGTSRVVDCKEQRCRAHCKCARLGLALGRNAPRNAQPRSLAGIVPQVADAVGVAAGVASVFAAVMPRPRSRSRSEGRRCSRSVIEQRLLSQWRFLSMEDRPLPPAGRADSGLVGFGTWADGLRGSCRARTEELLQAERWRFERRHDSVHLTLYLRWASEQLRSQAQSRVAALDVGRHIQSFLS